MECKTDAASPALKRINRAYRQWFAFDNSANPTTDNDIVAYASLPPLAAGRRQARFIASKYGMARSDVPDNPNLRYTAELVPPAPPLSAGLSDMRDNVMNTVKGAMAPTEAPISPDAQAAVAPPNPSLTQDAQDTEEAPDNVLPFIPIPEMTDAQQGSVPANEWEAAHAARATEVQSQRQMMHDLAAQIDATIAGVPPAAQLAPAIPGAAPAAAPPPKTTVPASGDPGEFARRKGAGGWMGGWKPGDAVGFNSADVENQNPGWSGKSSWTPHSSMDGAYATAGTPTVADASQRFYQRTYDRAKGGSRGDIVRFNRFAARNEQRDAN